MTPQAPQDAAYLSAVGTAAADAVIAMTKKDQPYARFQMKAEVNRETIWLSIIAFDAPLVQAMRQVRKDSRVDVAGKLQVRAYTGNDGKERTSVGIVASTFSLITQAGPPMHEDPYEDAPFFGMVGAMP